MTASCARDQNWELFQVILFAAVDIIVIYELFPVLEVVTYSDL